MQEKYDYSGKMRIFGQTNDKKMKKLILLAAALLAGVCALAQQQRVLLEYAGDVLSYGNKSVSLTQTDFQKTVKGWKIAKAHIVVSDKCPAASIESLLVVLPIEDVTLSVAMDLPVVMRLVTQRQLEEATPERPARNYDQVDAKPIFPAGDPAVWVREHLVYPASAREAGIQGRVTVKFTISQWGHVCNVVVVKTPDEALGKAAAKAISSMPDWIPGRQDGEAVPVVFVMPVNFKL